MTGLVPEGGRGRRCRCADVHERDATGAEGWVADLAVAPSTHGQADVGPGRPDEAVRVLRAERVEGGVDAAHRVVLGLGAFAESVGS